MFGTNVRERRALGVSFRRRPPVRQRQLRRRRALTISAAFIILVGLYFGVGWLVDRLVGSRPAGVAGQTSPQAVVGTAPLPFKAENTLSAGDLDGDGKPEQIALSAPANALRQIALVTGSGRSQRLVGQVLSVADFPLALRDLPRARGVLVQSGLLATDGQPLAEQVGGADALKAMGGEPDLKAWRLDGAKGLVPTDYYALAAPLAPPAADSLLVDKYLNVLWHYQGGELSGTYRVATGKHLSGPWPSALTQTINFLTPVGKFPIATKVPGMPYYRENIPAGDPRNPLGSRWIGFPVFDGDKALIWGIHGTNEPEQIGRWISDGCIRMRNADVEALYEKVSIGKTVLEIVDSRP